MFGKKKYKISVIIPVYNEKNTVLEIVKRVKKAYTFNNPKEIIIIDDASFDGTTLLLKDKIENHVSKVIYHKKNQGKGASLRDGIGAVTGDIVIIQDADLEYDPSEYSKLIKPIINEKADVVYGSRFIGAEPHRVLYFWHKVGNSFLTLFSNMLTNLDLTDMETCYKVFRTEIIKKIKIQENRFGIEPEITAKVSKMKVRIYEVGISYYGRTYEQGKKIGWKDGIRAVWSILKYNLNIKIIFITVIIVFLCIGFIISDFSIKKDFLINKIKIFITSINKSETENVSQYYKFYPDILKIQKFCQDNNIELVKLVLKIQNSKGVFDFYYQRICEMLFPVIIKNDSEVLLNIKVINDNMEFIEILDKDNHVLFRNK